MRKTISLTIHFFCVFNGLYGQASIVKYFGDGQHNYSTLEFAQRQNGEFFLAHVGAFYDTTNTIHLDVSPSGIYAYSWLSPLGDTIWVKQESGYTRNRQIYLEDEQGLFTLIRNGAENSSCEVSSWLPIWGQVKYRQMNMDGNVSDFKVYNPECHAVLQDAIALSDGNKLMVLNRTDNAAAFYPDNYAQIVILNYNNEAILEESLPDRLFHNGRLVKRDDCSLLMAFWENNHLKISILTHNGKIQDTKIYDNTIPKKFIPLGDGTFMLLTQDNNKRSFLYKIDKEGLVIWVKTFSQSALVDICKFQDQSLGLLFNDSNSKFGVAQMDFTGNLLKKRMYALPDTAAVASHVLVNEENKLAIAGKVGLYNATPQNFGPTNSFLLIDTISWDLIPPALQPASVQLQIFEDTNHNCVYDPGENLLPNWYFEFGNNVGSYSVPANQAFPTELSTYSITSISPPGEWSICPYDTLVQVSSDTVLFYGVENLCQTVHTDIDTLLCKSSWYKINGQYCEPGLNVFNLSTVSGCDSIVSIHLSVLPVAEGAITLEFCNGGSIIYNGLYYLHSDTLVFHFDYPGYCDSILTVNIIERPAAYNKTYTACSGNPVQVGNSLYTLPGIYTDTLSSNLGCDSVQITNIQPKFVSIYKSHPICPGSFVQIGNQLYMQPAIILDTVFYPDGCDTIFKHHIYYSAKSTFSTVYICQGESYSIGNSTYNYPGRYTDVFTSTNGCDSFVYTTLYFYNPIAFYNFKIYPGQVIQNGVLSFSSPGTFIDTLVSYAGCDSIITTSIHANNPVQYDNIDLCPGQTYTANGQTFTAPAIVCDTFISCYNLDSIYYLTLSTQYYHSEQWKYICPGETVSVGNSLYNTTGDYFDTIPNPNGCATIIKTRVLSGDKRTDLSVMLCPGQSITVGNEQYSSPGYHYIYLTTWKGCDSVIVLNIRNQYTQNKYLYLCPGDTIMVAGQMLSAPGSVKDTLSSLYGCDSIISYSVSWNKKTRYQYPKICPGDFIQVGNHTYSLPGNYRDTLTSWQGCDSIIFSTISWNNKSKNLSYSICPGDQVSVANSVYTSPGIYKDTLSTWLGCDSIISTSISWRSISKTINLEICDGGTLWVAGTPYTDPGIYRDSLVSWQGCDSILLINICHMPFNIETNFQQTICSGDTLWWSGNPYSNPGLYTDTLSSNIGCDSIVRLHLMVLPSYSDSTYLTWPIGTEFMGSTIFGDTVLVFNAFSGMGCDSVTNFFINATTNTKSPENAELRCLILPNPTGGQFSVQLFSDKSQSHDISIYNMLGVKVLHKETPPGQQILHISLGEAGPGLYRILVKANKRQYWVGCIMIE
jgi:Secretion system C-terminal sorting domain